MTLITKQEHEKLKNRGSKIGMRPNKKQPEFRLQVQICWYLRLKYPSVYFMSDTTAFLNLTMPQAVRNKQIQNENFHCPDLLIFESRLGYSGLFLELKIKSPYKKDGLTLLKNDHVERQAETIQQLQKRGYFAMFVWDFDAAKALIDKYLS